MPKEGEVQADRLERNKPWAHGVFGTALIAAWAVVILNQDGNSGPGFLVVLIVGVVGIGTVLRLLVLQRRL